MAGSKGWTVDSKRLVVGGNPVGGINTQTFTNQHIFMPPTTLAAMHAAAGMQHAHAQAQQMGQQHQADPRPAPGFASMRPPPQPMQQPQPIQPQQPSQHQQAQVKGRGEGNIFHDALEV